jgi:hypothetical protein
VLLMFSARPASLRRPACFSNVTTRRGVNRAAAGGVGAARSTFAAARCARFAKDHQRLGIAVAQQGTQPVHCLLACPDRFLMLPGGCFDRAG